MIKYNATEELTFNYHFFDVFLAIRTFNSVKLKKFGHFAQ